MPTLPPVRCELMIIFIHRHYSYFFGFVFVIQTNEIADERVKNIKRNVPGKAQKETTKDGEKIARASNHSCNNLIRKQLSIKIYPQAA